MGVFMVVLACVTMGRRIAVGSVTHLLAVLLLGGLVSTLSTKYRDEEVSVQFACVEFALQVRPLAASIVSEDYLIARDQLETSFSSQGTSHML